MPTSLPVRDRIFISYRRDDARGASGRLYDWLRIAFGREHVFRDVADIGVGRWRDKIDAALARTPGMPKAAEFSRLAGQPKPRWELLHTEERAHQKVAICPS